MDLVAIAESRVRNGDREQRRTPTGIVGGRVTQEQLPSGYRGAKVV